MTQDVYMSRRAVDSQAAQALEVALGTDGAAPDYRPLTCGFVRHQGLEPRTR
ncbi:MAG: hypothetical protein K0Q93_750 [Nocardioidaceae bacterium]|nr:hypothetical protein [Nocardioidaceae bacterium]